MEGTCRKDLKQETGSNSWTVCNDIASHPTKPKLPGSTKKEKAEESINSDRQDRRKEEGKRFGASNK